MSRETWYVLEDGSSADPREVKADDAGVLRHRSGKAVAMRGDVPRSRGVTVDGTAKEMRPSQPGPPYLTRDAGSQDPEPGAGASAGDISALRAEYQTKFGKKPYAGWDASTLREKIAATGD